MKRWLLHLRDLTMRITLAQSPRLAARDLMEMVISHSEIDAMRLSRCPQGIPGGRMPRRFAIGAPHRGPPRPARGTAGGGGSVLCVDSLGLPRKEVIQPHLPVRLPCYDFTPLTLHTFDASPPYGLGRRLRVQTTRVV